MIQPTLQKTPDTSCPSNLRISQPPRGYRFTSDSVALARFIRISPSESLLDLCTGVGIIPLLVWERNPFWYAVGIELQKELAELAAKNVRQNHLTEKILIVQEDLRVFRFDSLDLPQRFPTVDRFDVISANPPYRAAGSGRMGPNSQRALARHEIQLTFPQLIKACQQFLKPDGRFCFVHLAARETQVLGNLKDHGFTIRRKEYSRTKGHKALLLIEAGYDPSSHQS